MGSTRIQMNRVVFDATDYHKDASFSLEFQRTLRIPETSSTYKLPPGLGRFPLELVEDYNDTVPSKFREHGGIMFPMYQSEAMWINLDMNNKRSYPFALKIAAGSVNVIDGETIEDGLCSNGSQDYVSTIEQRWVDGFCTEKGKINQFVAMPLGNGVTVEEQITGGDHFGGIQIIAYPLKKEKWEEILHKRAEERANLSITRGLSSTAIVSKSYVEANVVQSSYSAEPQSIATCDSYQVDGFASLGDTMCFADSGPDRGLSSTTMSKGFVGTSVVQSSYSAEPQSVATCDSYQVDGFASLGDTMCFADSGPDFSMDLSPNLEVAVAASVENAAMGFGSGGSMEQAIEKDNFTKDDYDLDNPIMLYVNLCNSEDWYAVTGATLSYDAPNEFTYQSHGFPWFDYNSGNEGIEGSSKLAEVKSVSEALMDQGGDSIMNETEEDWAAVLADPDDGITDVEIDTMWAKIG